MPRKLTIAAAFLLFVSPPGQAQNQRAASGTFNDLLGKWSRGMRPGIAVAIVRDGRTQYEQTFGYADLNANVPVAHNTRFLAGSISKQFTATAILLLSADGKLRLDDAVSRFVPELPTYANAITIRQLMNHTGGLREHEELLAGKLEAGLFSPSTGPLQPPFTTSDAFDALRRAEGLRNAPGEKWEYSNTGYMVLGQVIERVCRCSYADFLKRRIFAPLKMNDSLVLPPPPARVDRLALAYRRNNGGWADISYSRLNFMVGHDGVVSTLQDMALWAAALESGKLLPAEAISTAFQPGSTNDGHPTNYGFGWRLSELNGRRVVQHEGCWSGYRNAIVHVPKTRLSAVVLTNAADGEEFWNCDDSVALARELILRNLADRN